ncbi:MAG: hypothetical protein CMC15_16290 [Flavobacteriaceae bacterium]|nr:hypothetical protein [Flavobacteriaceae bacterium]
MPLTLPADYASGLHQKNIAENWLLDLYGDVDSGYTLDEVVSLDETSSIQLNPRISGTNAEKNAAIQADLSVGQNIRIGDELMTITASEHVSASLINVTRAIGGTVQRSHADDSKLFTVTNLSLAFRDQTVESVQYYGAIKNRPSIRTNINLDNMTSGTGNVSIELINLDYQGARLSAELINGTRTYLNRPARIISVVNNNNDIDDGLVLFSGKLTKISLSSDGSTINLELETDEPWNRITFPQDKSSKYNIYVPTVYGGFTPNESTLGSPALVDMKLFPVPVVSHSQNDITTLMPRAYSSGSKSHINVWLEDNTFFPLSKATSSYDLTDTTETQGDINVLISPLTKVFTGISRAKFSEVDSSVNKFTNEFQAFDGDASTFATGTTTGTSSTNGSAIIAFSGQPRIFHSTALNSVYVDFKSSVTGNVDISLIFQSLNSALTESFTATVNVTDTSAIQTKEFDIYSANLPTDLNCALSFIYGASGRTISVSDIRVESRIFIYGGSNDDEDEQDSAELSRIKFMYSGGAGLAASYDSAAIEHGHEAHRCLLTRFADLPTTTPTGWDTSFHDSSETGGGVHDKRHIDAYKIRYWQLEPVSLKDKLDQLAYEFNFIFKYRPDRTTAYIMPGAGNGSNSAYQAGDVAATITGDDIEKNSFAFSHTNMSDIMTKMVINNELHPAESNKYVTKTTATNTTTREKYAFTDKQNINEINLDMNVGTPATTPAADHNTDWYSFMDHLHGELKDVVKCTIINPAIGYKLETGDVVLFSDMPINPGGGSWTSKYFMITDHQRTNGAVTITAREVSA